MPIVLSGRNVQDDLSFMVISPGTIRLEGLDLRTSETNRSPFILEDGSVVTLVLSGSNRFEAGPGGAGLRLLTHSRLTITNAPGEEAASLLSIGGDVSALTFAGGIVDARGGDGAAGVGKGAAGRLDELNMDGGSVWTRGGGEALDFSSGYDGPFPSPNIVGYEKISLNVGYNMIGVQFTQVGGEDLPLSTVATLDDSMAGFDEEGTYATEMQVWDGSNYTTYGWAGTSPEEFMEEASLNNQWLDYNDYVSVDDSLSAGAGFWIKVSSGTAGTLTIAGEVPSTDTVAVPLVAGFNMVANPYPGSAVVSDFGVLDSGLAGFDEEGTWKTEMQYWDGANYKTYGWAGTSPGEYMDESSLDNKWLDYNDYELVSDSIPFGHAVWIKAEKAGTITFSSPTK